MEPFERFWNYSLKYLSFRPRSIKETRDALRRKKALEEVIEQILQKLIDAKFLNDEDFAAWWVEQRTQFRPKGERIIKAELREKGIDQKIIDKVMQSLSSDSTQKATAVQLINKRVSRYKNIGLKELREKMFNFLVRNGFDFDVVRESIDEVLGREV